MKEAIRKHHISFKNAFAGLAWAFKTQPNFKVHLAVALAVILLGLYVSLTSNEWVLLILTIIWALSGEMINTAVESVTDLVTQEWREEAKIAKDVSAGMMLLVAMGACVIGIVLLGPKLLNKLVGRT